MIKNLILIVVLTMATLVSAIGVVHTQYKSRKLFAELQGLERAQDNLTIEFGQLQLEQSTWAAHGRLESVAREQLKMQIPVYNSIQYIELNR